MTNFCLDFRPKIGPKKTLEPTAEATQYLQDDIQTICEPFKIPSRTKTMNYFTHPRSH